MTIHLIKQSSNDSLSDSEKLSILIKYVILCVANMAIILGALTIMQLSSATTLLPESNTMATGTNADNKSKSQKWAIPTISLNSLLTYGANQKTTQSLPLSHGNQPHTLLDTAQKKLQATKQTNTTTDKLSTGMNSQAKYMNSEK